MLKRFSVAASLAALLLSGLGCEKKSGTPQTVPNPTPAPAPLPTPVWDPNAMRGVWITTAASSVLDSRANINQAVARCKSAGINHIFMVVYNNGRTMYPSAVMQNLIGRPILERFSGRDPLAEMIAECRANNIKIHAWFEYGFASSFSANGGDILAARPAWAARDANGSLTIKNGFDWLNAFNPAVQDFMISLFKEVATNYNVDGLQGDDRLPALPSTAGYDTMTQRMYREENNGANPPSSFSETNWINWRARKLNQFLKRLRTEVKAVKPNIMLTMSPSPYPWGLTEYLQDWPTWVDSGWVEAIIPQCYRYDINAYQATINQQRSFYRNTSVPFYPGVLLKSGNYLPSDGFLSQMIQANRAAGFRGEVFFFYEGIPDKLNYFQYTYPTIR